MEKLVVKTAVKTVLIILGIFVAVFVIFNFAFPQHMATATESIGNYDLAVKYASLRYNYTKNCDDLARCFDDSVLLGNDEYILDYGEKLIKHRDYEEVCKTKNLKQTGSRYDYNHWVKGKIAVSKYNTGVKKKQDKLKREAIDLAAAETDTETFEYGNPLMALAVCIKSEDPKDVDAATYILEKLDAIHVQAQTPEARYLSEVKNAMQTITKTTNN